MGDATIARRYALAFIELAAETRNIDALGAELMSMSATLRANDGELLRALSNPVFSVQERKSVLVAVQSRLGLQPLTRNLLGLLLDKGRFACLPDIATIYSELADDRAGRQRVIVTTAVPMTRDFEAEVAESLTRTTGKRVVLDKRVDPRLIGGVVARVGSKVYDASVRARLEDLRQKLLNAQLAGIDASGAGPADA